MKQRAVSRPSLQADLRRLIGAAQNAMVGDGGVNDVVAGSMRHVAVDAVVVLVHLAPRRGGQPAAQLGVALLADRLSQVGPQMARVDNGEVDAARLLAAPPALDVQLTRTMAALTTNARAAEDRFVVLADRVFHRLDPIAMAEQTFNRDLP